ncbi:MAG: hypothetical protein R3F59_35770 [Myxococcota bacterium]
MKCNLWIVLGVGLVACAGDGKGAGDTGATSPTGTSAGDDDDDMVTGDDDDDTTGAACHWLATYDLTGSQFFVQSTVDFTITVQEPYGDDLNTGPGRIVLRYPGDGTGPVDGEVAFVEYQLTWDFVTGVAGFANVHTAIENQAGPDPAGLTTGTLSGTTLAWDPATITVCQEGQIECTGPFCGTSGSPPEDAPEQVSGCEGWAIHDFTMSPDRATLEMAAAVVSSDGDTETAMAFHGTRVDLTEDCL